MERVQLALKGIAARLNRLVEKQKLISAASAEAIQRIRTGIGLQRFSDCDLVIESAVENEPVKREIFKNLCPVLHDKALICTNTSSISVTALAAHTDRPDRFMGMHFMNPVPVMRLVAYPCAYHQRRYLLGNKEGRSEAREDGSDLPRLSSFHCEPRSAADDQ